MRPLSYSHLADNLSKANESEKEKKKNSRRKQESQTKKKVYKGIALETLAFRNKKMKKCVRRKERERERKREVEKQQENQGQ